MRLLDLLAAALGLALLSPAFALLALAVKLTSPGPVFHRALRVGRDGRLFRLYKFRSMVVGAEKLGPRITTARDPRITPLGRYLRATKLDELPQLINVLKGEMSLVGPRPEDPRYVALYTPEQRRVLTVRPGITSLASLRYRAEESLLVGDDWERDYVERILPQKLAIELEYQNHRTVMADLGVILRTIVLPVWQETPVFQKRAVADAGPARCNWGPTESAELHRRITDQPTQSPSADSDELPGC